MNKEIKKGIKKILLVDTLISSIQVISNILDEADKEIDDFFGTTDAYVKNIKLLKREKDDYS